MLLVSGASDCSISSSHWFNGACSGDGRSACDQGRAGGAGSNPADIACGDYKTQVVVKTVLDPVRIGNAPFRKQSQWTIANTKS